MLMSKVGNTSTPDVVEVRHSHWQCSNVRMSSRDITCRYCHRTETISNGKEDFEYCPHCGSKMDEKDGVEVVRCKDCKHLTIHTFPTLYEYCEKTHYRFESFKTDTRTHFCGFGELKEREGK